MANLLFPPIVESTLPPIEFDPMAYAFNGKSDLFIKFQNPTTNIDYTHIRARLVLQETNKSIVKTAYWQDGFIYRTKENVEHWRNYFGLDSNFGVFRLNENGIMQKNLKPGNLIKLQFSYVYNSDETYSKYPPYPKDQNGKTIIYSDWLKTATYSEWSTVMLFKLIKIEQQPSIILNDTLGLNPVFYGQFKTTNESLEDVEKYKFNLLDSNKNLLETSGWITKNNEDKALDHYRFKTLLKDFGKYKIEYLVTTVNGYEGYGSLDHTAYENIVDEKNIAAIECVPDYEEGTIKIYFSWDSEKAKAIETNEIESGKYIISRADEKDNYSKWDDICELELDNFSGTNLLYTDFTIESGISYKYAVQKELYTEEEYPIGLRSARIYQQERNEYGQLVEAPPVCIYLQYSYLVYDGIQLKLKYNNKISSYKHTIMASKQDTIGSRYPTILRNGQAYYAEFPLSALISIHMDEDGQNFFQPKLYDYSNENIQLGLYYKDELVVPLGKLELATYPISTNLTQENIYVERIFREKVEEFLNDGTPKLFRSPTEGNHIVSLMNISMTPNQQLGRMISEFSSTAYEVMECTLENMYKYGILSYVNKKINNKDEVYLRGRIELFAGENLEAKALTRLSSKYLTTGAKIIQTDIEMGANVSGKICINSQSPNFLVNNYYNIEGNKLDISHDFEYPIYVGYTLKTKYADLSYQNDTMKGKKHVFVMPGYFDNTSNQGKREVTIDSSLDSSTIYFEITEELEKNNTWFFIQNDCNKNISFTVRIYNTPIPNSPADALWAWGGQVTNLSPGNRYTFTPAKNAAAARAFKKGNYVFIEPIGNSKFVGKDISVWNKGDIFDQLSSILTLSNPTKPIRTVLRILSLNFEGEGTIRIGNDPFGDDAKEMMVGRLGLTLNPVVDVRYLELSDNISCKFLVLAMERQLNEGNTESILISSEGVLG